MNNIKRFLSKNQTADAFNMRLKCFVDQYHDYKKIFSRPLRILDIGCGKNCELYKHKLNGDKYFGCDFYESINVKIDGYKRIDLNEEKLSNTFAGEKFDVIFCGEVIEHLFSPDDLLSEIKKLMTKRSVLILSTPNLGYYVNRIMLLFGISPLFLENSSEKKLGRKFKFFGQNNPTEGHIRLFTFGALLDIFKIKRFRIIKIKSVPIWDNPFERIICTLSRSLSADNVFVLQIE